jgi:hypothetical protein
MRNRGTMKCPVPGCNQDISPAGLHPDKALKRRLMLQAMVSEDTRTEHTL